MLITNKVKLKWNSKIKKHYVDLGYTYTKMGDEFEVYVKDLTHASNVIVDVVCDYCHEIYQIKWDVYNRLKNKEVIHKDCCGNPECTGAKAQEALLVEYGVNKAGKIDGVNEKIKQTNIVRYGCENPFGNEIVKAKIIDTNIEKYGVPYSMQNNDVKEKSKLTCIEKYGVDNYAKTEDFREKFRGENSPVWKENPKQERIERGLPEYRDWRKAVFERDHYTCQCCGSKNYKGNGTCIILNAHHIQNFSTHKDIAMDVNNGITLCEKCHNLFHSIYGKKENNQEQLNNFIKNQNIDEKVC